jgi:hypothetical protein
MGHPETCLLGQIQPDKRQSSLFLLQPGVHVLLLELFELDTVVDAFQTLVYSTLSARCRMLLKELGDICTLFFGTKIS